MNYSEIIDEIVSQHQVTLNDMILGYTDHLKLHIGHIHELMEE